MKNMKISKCVLFGSMFLFSVPSVFSQEYYTSTSVSPYSDPAFQDYAETSYGYLNPKLAPKINGDFRDALRALPTVTLKDLKPAPQLKAAVPAVPAPKPVVSGTLSQHVPGQFYKVTFANENGPLTSFVAPLNRGITGFKAGDYVFITILPVSPDYSSVLDGLAQAGFKFAGEKTAFFGSGKKTFILGWVPYSNLNLVYKNPGVRSVSIEKKTAGLPLKTRVRFTLKAPSGERSTAFVNDFIDQLNKRTGFVRENVFRLPQNSEHSKFTAFDVTGNLPVDMVGELSQSPFVAAIAFKDKSL